MMYRGFCLLAVFYGAYAFTGDLSAWDVSAVTNMKESAPRAIHVSANAHIKSVNLIGSWVVVCNVRGWQCAEGGRGGV
jgi:surface protein